MKKKGVSHPSWLRPSKIPVTIVCGPPCSGKTTYVQERIQEGELCIDLDEIVKKSTNLKRHSWDEGVLDKGLYERNRLLSKLSKPSKYTKAWFIVSEPKEAWRKWWCRKLGTEDIVVLETSENICKSRTNNLIIREAITKWWTEYKTSQNLST